tara:strand:- start:2227 stop:2487 length:261 start_codon:yes stop_codon:yes gene_type:complete
MKNWETNDKYLVKSFSFKKYLDGISFVDEVALISEKNNHHPEIEILWCKVIIKLTSHDAGKITERDIKLSNDIDNLFNQGITSERK